MLRKAPAPEDSFDALAHRLYSVVDMLSHHRAYMDGLSLTPIPAYQPPSMDMYRGTLDSLLPEAVTVPVVLDCLLMQVEANAAEAQGRPSDEELRQSRGAKAGRAGTATSQRKDKDRPSPPDSARRVSIPQGEAAVAAFIEAKLGDMGFGEELLAALDQPASEGEAPSSGGTLQLQGAPRESEGFKQLVVRHGDAVASHYNYLATSLSSFGDYNPLEGARRVLAASRAAQLVRRLPERPLLSEVERASHDQQLLNFCKMPLPDVKRALELLEFERMAATALGACVRSKAGLQFDCTHCIGSALRHPLTLFTQIHYTQTRRSWIGTSQSGA
jgi:hypothetical protein